MNDPVYRIYVNEKRTVLLTIWRSGGIEIAMRDDPGAVWGPPVQLTEERT